MQQLQTLAVRSCPHAERPAGLDTCAQPHNPRLNVFQDTGVGTVSLNVLQRCQDSWTGSSKLPPAPGWLIERDLEGRHVNVPSDPSPIPSPLQAS